MDKNTKITQSEKVAFEKVAKEAILIHLDTGTYFSLNDIGTEFWEMFDGQATVEEMAVKVAEKYGVDTGMVISDLIELAEKLAADQLILTR